jgi:4-carboxymuconolactone decarboxylase
MDARIRRVQHPSNEVADLLALASAPERGTPGTIEVLAHRPPMLSSFLTWARILAREGVLSRHDHEILALRASINCRSPFEWGEHLIFARMSGLTDDDIDRIAAGPDAPGWQPHEAALMRCADQLHHGCQIDDATWAVLASRYDEAQLVEIVYVVGQYTMLSMVANGLRVDVPETFTPLPGPGR